MIKVYHVAMREFLATVRTRAFVLSVVMMPAIMVVALYGTQWVQSLSRQEKLPLRRLAVVDHSGAVAPVLAAQVAQFNAERPNQPFEVVAVDPPAADIERFTREVNAGELYGFLIVAEDAVTGAGGCVLARRDNQLQVGEQIERMVRESIYAVRMQNAGIDPVAVAVLRAREVPIERWDAKTGGAVSSNVVARALTPFAFMFLLFMGTFGISQGLLTTLIEEKSSRVVEVLLSAVSPTQLLAGKIIGMAAVGLLLIVVWGGVGYTGARSYQLGDLVNTYRLTVAVMYFIPGFLLMASIMAAIGSACNELKEAQSMVFPISFITIVPMIFWFYLSEHPASVFSLVLSFVPPITPFVMILRVCADPDTPLWQVWATLLVLWASVVVTIWAAGKIFRVGVLMYGKPPSPVELLRWVRHT